VRGKVTSLDDAFDAIYYSFTVVLMTLGISLNFWITSWIAFPITLLICWILGKSKRFKRVEIEDDTQE